jgi:hypothetical protein
VSILDLILLNPIHLALGVYGLVILFDRETALLFNRGAENLAEQR